MTFSAMYQALYDRLGFTGETTMVKRLINEGKDQFVSAHKWPWLESSATVTFQTNVTAYTLGTDVGDVLEMDDANSLPLEGIHRDTFEDLYRPSTATATNPTTFCMQGAATTGALVVTLWPKPAVQTLGTVRYLRRVPDMSADGDTPQHVPSELHWVIVDLAEVLFHQWEDSEQAPVLAQRVDRRIKELAGATQEDVLHDRT